MPTLFIYCVVFMSWLHTANHYFLSNPAVLLFLYEGLGVTLTVIILTSLSTRAPAQANYRYLIIIYLTLSLTN